MISQSTRWSSALNMPLTVRRFLLQLTKPSVKSISSPSRVFTYSRQHPSPYWNGPLRCMSTYTIRRRTGSSAQAPKGLSDPVQLRSDELDLAESIFVVEVRVQEAELDLESVGVVLQCFHPSSILAVIPAIDPRKLQCHQSRAIYLVVFVCHCPYVEVASRFQIQPAWRDFRSRPAGMVCASGGSRGKTWEEKESGKSYHCKAEARRKSPEHVDCIIKPNEEKKSGNIAESQAKTSQVLQIHVRKGQQRKDLEKFVSPQLPF